MSVRKFYSGKTVMVTGGTGFMGKVLIEKLIRSLPEITRIYAVVRPKKGLSPEERLAAITSKMPFTHRKIDSNAIKEKLVVLHGDVTVESLGLSGVDRQKVIDEVCVVFHLAASIRMNLSLKDAVLQNVIGTQNVLNLCTEMKYLISVVHLSTAYCNVDIECVEEKVYAIKNPYEVINLSQWLEDKELRKIEKSLITPHPNTYTYTKRLAEIIVNDLGTKLPLSIGRPSIVVSALREPIPGWIDTLNGPVGLSAATLSGVLKSMLGDENICPDLICVDAAINGLLLIGFVTATHRFEETPVYNLSKGFDYPLSYREYNRKFKNIVNKYPLKMKLSYATGSLTTNHFLHYITVMFWHVFVAHFVDFFLFLFRQKPFLVNLHGRLSQGMELLKYFVNRKFTFTNDKSDQLHNSLAAAELNDFFITAKDVDMDEYLLNAYAVCRKVCLNDEIIESEVYRRRLENNLLYLLDGFYKCVMAYGFIWSVLYIFGISYLLNYNFWF